MRDRPGLHLRAPGERRGGARTARRHERPPRRRISGRRVSGVMAGSVQHLALLDAVPDAIVLAGADGTIVFANQAALALFGYAAPELVGSPAERLVPERYRGGGEGLERVAALPTGGRGYNVRIHGLRRDGTEFQVETSIARADLDGAPVVVATF